MQFVKINETDAPVENCTVIRIHEDAVIWAVEGDAHANQTEE